MRQTTVFAVGIATFFSVFQESAVAQTTYGNSVGTRSGPIFRSFCESFFPTNTSIVVLSSSSVRDLTTPAYWHVVDGWVEDSPRNGSIPFLFVVRTCEDTDGGYPPSTFWRFRALQWKSSKSGDDVRDVEQLLFGMAWADVLRRSQLSLPRKCLSPESNVLLAWLESVGSPLEACGSGKTSQSVAEDKIHAQTSFPDSAALFSSLDLSPLESGLRNLGEWCRFLSEINVENTVFPLPADFLQSVKRVFAPVFCVDSGILRTHSSWPGNGGVCELFSSTSDAPAKIVLFLTPIETAGEEGEWGVLRKDGKGAIFRLMKEELIPEFR